MRRCDHWKHVPLAALGVMLMLASPAWSACNTRAAKSSCVKSAACATHCAARSTASVAAVPAPAATPAIAATPLRPIYTETPATAPLTPLGVAAGVAPGVAGIYAYIDPETGQITATTIPLEAPDLSLRANVDALVPVRMPNGSWMLDLQGTGDEYALLELDPLGKRILTCVHGASAPHAAAKPAARTAPTTVLSPYTER